MALTDRPRLDDDAAFVVALHQRAHARGFVVTPKEDRVRAATNEVDREERVVVDGGGPSGCSCW
ncbi:MAG: hypothetical protein ABR975_01755 [Vulcanimicrobiaceae bacterium]